MPPSSKGPVHYMMQRVPDGRAYMLGCANFKADPRRVDLKETGTVSRRALKLMGCRNSTNRGQGHPCQGCTNWEPRQPGAECPSCGLHLAWGYFLELGEAEEEPVQLDGETAIGPCPGCKTTVKAVRSGNVVEITAT